MTPAIQQPSESVSIEARLERIEQLLTALVGREPTKEFYTTAELGKLLGKSDYTVREWCRAGRVHALKRPCGHGNSKEWIVSHEEVNRLRNHGLLPLQAG